MNPRNAPEEIISLLRSKFRCLERLMSATQEFLKTPTENLLLDSGDGNDALSVYENERHAIVKTIEMHDRRISALISDLGESDRNPELAEEASREMSAIERLITHIFNADDVVFERIREAQEQISRMTAENRRNAGMLSKFKSAPAKTGDGMDTTL